MKPIRPRQSVIMKIVSITLFFLFIINIFLIRYSIVATQKARTDAISKIHFSEDYSRLSERRFHMQECAKNYVFSGKTEYLDTYYNYYCNEDDAPDSVLLLFNNYTDSNKKTSS